MELNALLKRLQAIEVSHLADADKSIRIMDSGIRPLQLGRKLIGRALTAVCREDFMTVTVALAQAVPGDVLVIATLGSRRAVLGELFSLEAQRRGLAGIIVDGPVRDTVTLRQLSIPVYARSATPLAGTVNRLFPTQVPVCCGGVTVNPGDILFGDEDGVAVVSEEELRTLMPTAEAIEARERAVIARLAAGESLLTLINFDEHHRNLREGRTSALRFEVG
jgi:4-hydroxy-4-methyl-2-oxoglutarate aldolase